MVRISLYFSLAWIVHQSSWWLASLILRLYLYRLTLPGQLSSSLGRLTQTRRWSGLGGWLPTKLKRTNQLSEQRQETLQELVANTISLLAFSVVGVASLYEFIQPDTIVWMAGLIGSALAFAGRTQIGDLLAGIGIIFHNPFDVGEKVLLKAQLEKFEGFIERVSLTTTWVRAQTGELYIIPNGEMRFICNYSRGLHSATHVTLKIAADDLDRALPLLKNLGEEATGLLPELQEPWLVISETGVMGKSTELTLVVKSQFGQAATLRPQLLQLVQKRLALADITLAG